MKLLIHFDTKTDKANPMLLGGKGASLARMTQLGLPVPPGFTLTTQAWKLFNDDGKLSNKLQSQIFDAIKKLEKKTGQEFGSKDNPLLLSVRSGAVFSMPGMMDTILNVGINEEVVSGFSDNQQFAWDTYRRFVKMFASSVYGIHEGEFDLLGEPFQKGKKGLGPRQTKDLVGLYKKLIFERTGQQIPKDPRTQLIQAITAVSNSWFNLGAVAFRQINGIPGDIGTAVNIQAMVFGNKDNSGTGVLFTRDTQTGENSFSGDYMEEAQGQEIVRGASAKTTLSIADFAKKYPQISKKLFNYSKKLEKLYKDVQDIEFTVDNNKIWMLQSRSAKRSPLANIRFAKDLLEEKVITETVALRRVKPGDIEHLTSPIFSLKDEEKRTPITKGVSASSGVASGIMILDPDQARSLSKEGKKVILIGDHIDPNDVDTMMLVEGIITTKGSASSHMAIIMRSAGTPGIVGCSNIMIANDRIIIGQKNIKVGEKISINATRGVLYEGTVKKSAKAKPPEDISKFVQLRKEKLGESPWSAALYLEEQAPNFESLLKSTEKKWVSTKNKWQSQKARVVELTNAVFSKEQIISSKLVKPSDTPSLKEALLSVVGSGYFNAPRTCHNPEKLAGAPWADGPNTKNEVDDFLNSPNYPGKYGGYPKWITDETLSAIIVSNEPEGKLDSKLAQEHFVCTISCLSAHPPQVVVSINFGTAQLRSLERVETPNLATIKASLHPKAKYELGNISYQVGDEYYDKTKIKRMLRVIQRNNWAQKNTDEENIIKAARHLLKQMVALHPDLTIENLDQTSFTLILKDLMAQESLPEDVYQHIIKTQIMTLLDKISKKIFDNWWKPPMALPYLMTALDETAGLTVVEAQGRFKGNDLVWFKIYGTKGAEEKEKIKNWQNG